ncbi:hypothetical protein PV04_05551 [Phialophora macrospora]|uniref:Uncharacterized protein n=1 Tax=Phialophora macrospora TaxID=1851006 RepID=A0A0D2GC68_9EURO|nr:hypothetical protein PV04_05551 [Phialophora macrospora]
MSQPAHNLSHRLQGDNQQLDLEKLNSVDASTPTMPQPDAAVLSSCFPVRVSLTTRPQREFPLVSDLSDHLSEQSSILWPSYVTAQQTRVRTLAILVPCQLLVKSVTPTASHDSSVLHSQFLTPRGVEMVTSREVQKNLLDVRGGIRAVIDVVGIIRSSSGNEPRLLQLLWNWLAVPSNMCGSIAKPISRLAQGILSVNATFEHTGYNPSAMVLFQVEWTIPHSVSTDLQNLTAVLEFDVNSKLSGTAPFYPGIVYDLTRFLACSLYGIAVACATESVVRVDFSAEDVVITSLKSYSARGRVPARAELGVCMLAMDIVLKVDVAHYVARLCRACISLWLPVYGEDGVVPVVSSDDRYGFGAKYSNYPPLALGQMVSKRRRRGWMTGRLHIPGSPLCILVTWHSMLFAHMRSGGGRLSCDSHATGSWQYFAVRPRHRRLGGIFHT